MWMEKFKVKTNKVGNRYSISRQAVVSNSLVSLDVTESITKISESSTSCFVKNSLFNCEPTQTLWLWCLFSFKENERGRQSCYKSELKMTHRNRQNKKTNIKRHRAKKTVPEPSASHYLEFWKSVWFQGHSVELHSIPKYILNCDSRLIALVWMIW